MFSMKKRIKRFGGIAAINGNTGDKDDLKQSLTGNGSPD